MDRVAALLCLLTTTIIAQSPATFTATGSMTTPRIFHSATLLSDGRVLIAGGEKIAPPVVFTTLSNAEIYDPRTGIFTATGSMAAARLGHTATLLANGKVLIAGGAGASAELYNPATGAFSPTGSMTTPRKFPTAALLANGKVLIAGGGPTAGAAPNRSAELYDPSTGIFSATGDMTWDTADTATLLPNGKVLITRGTPDVSPPYLAEVYDPSSGTFSPTGKMTMAHTQPTATVLANGKVLIAGGDVGDGDGPSSVAELYDSATGTFTPTGRMITGREQDAASVLSNGTVLMAGGHNVYDSAISAEIYDPVKGSFSSTAGLPGPRELHTATLLQDGRVLIAGGDNENYWSPQTILATAELYIPPTPDSWQNAIAAMKSAAGADSANFWQWAYEWQYLAAFAGAPAGFGVVGSISPDVMYQIIVAGGGDGFRMVSAEEWVLTYRQVTQPPDPFQQAVAAMKAAAGTDNLNFWQWAWYWQYLPAFPGAPAGFGVVGSISTAAMDQIIVAGGGDGFRLLSAEQWVQYYHRPTTVSSVVNAASHLPGPVAPGELVVITGSGLGPANIVSAIPNGNGLYDVQLAGTTVLVNGKPVPLISTSATQVTAVFPDSLIGGAAQVTVAYQGQTSALFPVPVAPAAPGIFTVDSTGQGHAATINQNGLTNTPAHWGDVMTLFVTGVGQAASTVTIHGYNLSMIPLSVDKGMVPGVMRIKVAIPFGQDCDTQVLVQVGNATSQPGVTIAMDTCI